MTFTGTQNNNDITLTVSGSLADGKIPVNFTTAAFGVNIIPPVPPAFTSPHTAPLQYGYGGTIFVTATGTPSDMTYSLSGAPAGVTIDENTGDLVIPYALPAGVYTFTITADNGVPPNAVQTFTLTVTQKPLENTMINPASLPTVSYNGSPHTPVPIVTDGTLINPSDYTVSYTNNTDAGTATVTITAADTGNYSGTAGRTFTITPAAYTGAAPAYTRNVRNGAADTLTIDLTPLHPSVTGTLGTVSYTYTGMTDSTPPIINGTPTVSGGNLMVSVNNMPEGSTDTAEININIISQNYGTIPAVLTLKCVDKTTLDAGIVTLANRTATYDGTPQAIGAWGVINADSYSGGPFAATEYYYENADADTPAYNDPAPPTAAGTYTVTVTAENDDYIGTATATLTIERRTLTITGLTAINRIYDGTLDITLTGGALYGIVSGDEGDVTADMPTSGTMADANAGTAAKPVTLPAIPLTGAKAGNYTLTQPAVTVVISPRAITVTPSANQSKIYGAADPVFAYTASETLIAGNSFSGALGRSAGEDAGVYAYTLGSLSAGGNYVLTIGGSNTFSITQATVTGVIPVNPVTKTAFEAKDAAVANAIAGITLPASVSVTLNSGGSAALPVIWATTDTYNAKGAAYTFTGTLTGNANIYAPASITVSAAVTITPVTAANPEFAPASVVISDEQAVNAAALIAQGVLPISGNITAEGVSVAYTINWNGGQTLDRRAIDNSTTFTGIISYPNPPAWLTLPVGNTVSRLVTVIDKTQVTLSGVDIPDMVYTGAAHPGYTGTPVFRDANGAAVTVTGTLGAVYSGTEKSGAAYSGVVPPVNAGDYTVSLDLTDPVYFMSEPWAKPFQIKKAPQDAPQGLNKTNETGTGKNDGTIYPVTNKMEYKAAADTVYISVPAGQSVITGLPPGKYLVRYKEDNNHNPGADAEVVISAYNPPKNGWYEDKDGNWYYYTNGEPITDDWIKDGAWYFLGEDGIMLTDEWVLYDGALYYLTDTGRMLAGGWLLYDGEWYFFGGTGAMKTEDWQRWGEIWYYLDENGKMVSDCWVIYNGRWYYLGEAGGMLCGEWVRWRGAWYYLDPTGAMITGWFYDEYYESWFYFHSPGGNMAQNGWVRSGGQWYYLKSGGYMAYGEWVEWKEHLYYLNEDGVMLSGGVFEIDGELYEFDDTGALVE